MDYQSVMSRGTSVNNQITWFFARKEGAGAEELRGRS